MSISYGSGRCGVSPDLGVRHVTLVARAPFSKRLFFEAALAILSTFLFFFFFKVEPPAEENGTAPRPHGSLGNRTGQWAQS
jgi:hypothetical protein